MKIDAQQIHKTIPGMQLVVLIGHHVNRSRGNFHLLNRTNKLILQSLENHFQFVEMQIQL